MAASAEDLGSAFPRAVLWYCGSPGTVFNDCSCPERWNWQIRNPGLNLQNVRIDKKSILSKPLSLLMRELSSREIT